MLSLVYAITTKWSEWPLSLADEISIGLATKMSAVVGSGCFRRYRFFIYMYTLTSIGIGMRHVAEVKWIHDSYTNLIKTWKRYVHDKALQFTFWEENRRSCATFQTMHVVDSWDTLAIMKNAGHWKSITMKSEQRPVYNNSLLELVWYKLYRKSICIILMCNLEKVFFFFDR